MKIKTYILTLLILSVSGSMYAQEDKQYRMELGGGINLNSYLGDFSANPFSGICPGGTVVSRWIINPWSALRFNIMVTQIKGSGVNAETYFPEESVRNYSFKNLLGDFSVTYEYNFLPYGTGKDYRGAKRFTPFISLGIGLTYVNSQGGTIDYAGSMVDGVAVPTMTTNSNVVTGNIPIGVGVKYKIGKRLNLTFDWQMHFSFSDRLDGVKDPYCIQSSGLFKNTDCYSTFTLALTYSLAPKCVTCHNDRE